LALTAAAIGLMCLASSAGYLVNDVRDASVDRLHPIKQLRPIASGELGKRTALVLAILLAATSLGLSFALHRPGFTAVIAAYLVITVLYSVWLKHESVIEIGIVSSGFVLRALAGGQATGVPLSRWFLLVAAFGSLFLVAGKRVSELTNNAGDPVLTRRSLADYSVGYLRFVWQLAAAITVTAYCMWGFGLGLRSGSVDWEPISVAPFVLALMRYAQHVDRGDAAEPEELALHDRTLQLLAVAWLIPFTLGAYSG
jgi:decaprenyl-phosphate phosphoribosyltransferase